MATPSYSSVLNSKSSKKNYSKSLMNGMSQPLTEKEYETLLIDLQKNYSLIKMNVFGIEKMVRGNDKHILVTNEATPKDDVLVCRAWFEFFTTHVSLRPSELSCKCDGNHRGPRYVPPCQHFTLTSACRNDTRCRFAHLIIGDIHHTDQDECKNEMVSKRDETPQLIDLGNEIIMWIRIDGKLYAFMRVSSQYDDDEESKRIEIFYARNVPTETPIQSTIRALYESSAWLFDFRKICGDKQDSSLPNNIWQFNNIYHGVFNIDTTIPVNELLTKIFDENQLKLARALRAGERAAALTSVGLVLVPLDEKERMTYLTERNIKISSPGGRILQDVSKDSEMIERLNTCEPFRLQEAKGKYNTITFTVNI